MYLVSKEVWERLRDHRGDCGANPAANPIFMPGARIELSPLLPIPKKRLRSLDRFAEYDSRDACWAVPAGLAEWVDETVHIMEFPDNLFSTPRLW